MFLLFCYLLIGNISNGLEFLDLYHFFIHYHQFKINCYNDLLKAITYQFYIYPSEMNCTNKMQYDCFRFCCFTNQYFVVINFQKNIISYLVFQRYVIVIHSHAHVYCVTQILMKNCISFIFNLITFCDLYIFLEYQVIFLNV